MKSGKVEHVTIIKSEFQRLGIVLNDSKVAAFRSYLDMIKKWSRAYNLTSVRKDSDIVIRHFIDSVSYLKVTPEEAQTVLDVGSGAGFPGVPMKIIRPELNVSLVEPSRKKASFLKNLVKTLGLTDITVLCCRVEEYPCTCDDAPEAFDVITTRALFKAVEFVNKAEGLCKDDGVLIMSKGPTYDQELEGLDRARCDVVDADLQDFGLERYLIVIRPS